MQKIPISGVPLDTKKGMGSMMVTQAMRANHARAYTFIIECFFVRNLPSGIAKKDKKLNALIKPITRALALSNNA